MQLPKKRIHLDRVEILIVMVVLVLSHGLLYVLGVLSGFGLHPQNTAGPHLTESAHEVTSEKSAGRAPAAEGEADAKSAGVPGAGLRRAYRESKQQAFVEMALRKDTSQKPRSVSAAEAHMESHPDWARKPSSVIGEVMASAPVPSQKTQKAPSSDESSVRKLFERKPSSVDHFVPRPGYYTVQVASYATEEEAQAKISELRGSGFNEAFVQSYSKNKGNQWHRVAIGSFKEAEWAKKTGDKLVHRKLAHDFIVKQVQ